MTKEEAIEMGESGWWIGKSPAEIVAFQLYENKLCMPFDTYQEAIEAVLGRPVWTHEFAFPDNLRREFEGKCDAAGMQQSLDLIPADKLVVIVK